MENSEREKEIVRGRKNKNKKRKQVKSYQTLRGLHNGSRVIRRKTLRLYSDETSSGAVKYKIL